MKKQLRIATRLKGKNLEKEIIETYQEKLSVHAKLQMLKL